MRDDYPENNLQTDKTLYVRELQMYLREIAQADARVPLIGVDGHFCKETTAAVKATQRIAHLPETGRVDFATWNAIVRAARNARRQMARPLACAPYTRLTVPVHQGEHNAVIPFAQSMFNALCCRFKNFQEETVCDEMTDVTCQNVQEIQRVCGHTPTGELDAATWNELTTAFNLCAVDRYVVATE